MQEKKVDANDAKEKRFWVKVKEHKTEIIIVTATVLTAVASVIVYKKGVTINVLKNENMDKYAKESKNISPILTEIIENSITDDNLVNKTINVPEYMRKLPKDYRHSQNAVELAKSFGYELLDDETFVRPYSYLKISA